MTPSRIAIERRQGLSPDRFYEEYLNGAGRPVIVTDAVDSWPARSKWSFEFFKSRYGGDTVTPAPELSSRSCKVMKLADYIDYIAAPGEISPGFWIDKAQGTPLKQPRETVELPLYLYGWDPFSRHPELFEDIRPSPYFVDDWLVLLPPEFRRLLQVTPYRPSWVLIGPKGSLSRLHFDFFHSHAYLALIAGRKKCVLFSPEDSDHIYRGAVDPEQPDPERFPLYERAAAYEGVIGPGETLFIPAGWWHYVAGLEPTITVSYNFFNRANFGEYFVSLLRALPGILERFDRVPDWRASLGVEWVSKGFERASSGAKQGE